MLMRTNSHIEGTKQPSKDGGSRWERALRLRRGDELLLVPEPDNPVDRNAILIYKKTEPNHDIGHVAASCAARICRMMECGATFSAEVYWIENSQSGWHRVFFQIKQLTEMTSKRRPMRRGAPKYNRTAHHPATEIPIAASLIHAPDEHPSIVDTQVTTGWITGAMIALRSLFKS